MAGLLDYQGRLLVGKNSKIYDENPFLRNSSLVFFRARVESIIDMEKRFLKLNDIDAYKIAFSLSNYVWDVVVKWDYFSKKTIGGQFVEAMDSISANIAEGFGRYFKKDKIKFYWYSSGSVKESLDWNEKSKIRGLLKPAEYEHIFGELQKLPAAINRLIKFTNEKLSK